MTQTTIVADAPILLKGPAPARPKLDVGFDGRTALIFFGILAFGLFFIAYSLYVDNKESAASPAVHALARSYVDPENARYVQEVGYVPLPMATLLATGRRLDSGVTGSIFGGRGSATRSDGRQFRGRGSRQDRVGAMMATVTAPVSSGKDSLAPALVDRDLSWLDFNRRVLAEALDDRTPLLERAKFLAIFGSNLDEFFMKRMAIRREDQSAKGEWLRTEIRARLQPMLSQQAEQFQRVLVPQLSRHGIHLRRWEELTGERVSRRTTTSSSTCRRH